MLYDWVGEGFGRDQIYNAMNDCFKIVIVLLSTLQLLFAFSPEILQLDF
jgi:hypothetical protein